MSDSMSVYIFTYALSFYTYVTFPYTFPLRVSFVLLYVLFRTT